MPVWITFTLTVTASQSIYVQADDDYKQTGRRGEMVNFQGLLE